MFSESADTQWVSGKAVPPGSGVFAAKKAYPQKDTIVDSTIIAAPSSTKNQEKQRNPDAHLVKKEDTWYFGYKAHVGVNRDTDLIPTVEVTGANTHDIVMTSGLLIGDEESVYGDGYLGADKRENRIRRNRQGRLIRYRINRRPSQIGKKPNRAQSQLKRKEHEKSSVRTKAEHVFAVVKGQFRYRKTRLPGKPRENRLPYRRACYDYLYTLFVQCCHRLLYVDGQKAQEDNS